MPNPPPDVFDFSLVFHLAEEFRKRNTVECRKRMNPSIETKARRCTTMGRAHTLEGCVTIGICEDHYVELLADPIVLDGMRWVRRRRWHVELYVREGRGGEGLTEAVDRLERMEMELERHVRNWLNYMAEDSR